MKSNQNGTSDTRHTQFDPAELPTTEPGDGPEQTQLERLAAAEDTQGDPEGVEERRSVTRSDFPEWAFNEFTLSSKNYYGTPFEDGQMHLIPREDVINQIISLHTASVEDARQRNAMIELARKDLPEEVEAFGEAVEAMLDGVTDNALQYEVVVQALGTATNTAMAERAVDKFTYLSAIDRVRPGDEQPDWVQNIQDRMFKTAARAGLWYIAHRHAWTIAEYKGEPKYFVDSAVKRRLINKAEWVEKNHYTSRALRPSQSDQAALAAMC